MIFIDKSTRPQYNKKKGVIYVNLTHRDPFNFTVGNIEFVILREADPRWRMDRLTPQNHYSLALARSGSATYETDHGTFPVKSGDVLFFRKGENRSAESAADDPWSFISVVFDLIPLGKTAEEELAQIPRVTTVRDLPAYTRIFSALLEEWSLRDEGTLLRCRSLISELLCLLIKEARHPEALSPHAEAVEKVRDLLAESYTTTYRSETLAAMAGLSPSHFRALFKEQTGETALQFQNRLRIAKACDLLRSGACNVTEAAYATGFTDVYYFSRLFKKITGRSPSQYL